MRGWFGKYVFPITFTHFSFCDAVNLPATQEPEHVGVLGVCVCLGCIFYHSGAVFQP